MITEFSAHPKAQNNNAKIIMAIFFAIAAAAAVAAVMMKNFRGVVGMIAVACITTAILIYTKYVSVKFYYDILVEGYEEPYLIVRQQVGKRNVTLARIALADITDIKKETAEERRAHKREKRTVLFVYGPTLSPQVSFRLSVNSGREKCEVILEGSDEFFEKVKEFSVEARSMRLIEEENEEY